MHVFCIFDQDQFEKPIGCILTAIGIAKDKPRYCPVQCSISFHCVK